MVPWHARAYISAGKPKDSFDLVPGGVEALGSALPSFTFDCSQLVAPPLLRYLVKRKAQERPTAGRL